MVSFSVKDACGSENPSPNPDHPKHMETLPTFCSDISSGNNNEHYDEMELSRTKGEDRSGIELPLPDPEETPKRLLSSRTTTFLVVNYISVGYILLPQGKILPMFFGYNIDELVILENRI